MDNVILKTEEDSFGGYLVNNPTAGLNASIEQELKSIDIADKMLLGEKGLEEIEKQEEKVKK